MNQYVIFMFLNVSLTITFLMSFFITVEGRLAPHPIILNAINSATDDDASQIFAAKHCS